MLTLVQSRREIKVNRHLAERLKTVVHLLHKSYKLYNQIAKRASNKRTELLVYSLATESNQYHSELKSKVQILEKKYYDTEPETTRVKWNVVILNEKKFDNTEEILNDCAVIETAIIKAYRDLLNDPSIMLDLRKLLQQQLNGFLYSFVKLKMLESISQQGFADARVLF